MADQLKKHVATNSLDEKFQLAYKNYHSTETAIVRVHNDILCAFDKGKSVILLLLDLKAAFDTVNHFTLLIRLSTRFGTGGKALAWFKSYLSSRSQFVRINVSTSKSYDLLSGVHKAPFWALFYTPSTLLHLQTLLGNTILTFTSMPMTHNFTWFSTHHVPGTLIRLNVRSRLVSWRCTHGYSVMD